MSAATFDVNNATRDTIPPDWFNPAEETEETPPIVAIWTKVARDIENFVNTSDLFQQDKQATINRLCVVARKAETAEKVNRLATSLHMMNPQADTIPLLSDPDFANLVVLARVDRRIDDIQLSKALHWKVDLHLYGPEHLLAGKPLLRSLVPSHRDIVKFVNESELFKYVDATGEAILRLDRVANKAETVTKLDQVSSLLNTGPMTIGHPLFSDPDFEELVVLALISKRIYDYQLGTAFYFKSVLCCLQKEHLIKEVPLFIDGEINPEARQLMRETVQTLPILMELQKTFALDIPPPEPILQDREIDLWFARMRRMPASEKILLVREMPPGGDKLIAAYNASFTLDMSTEERLRRFREVYGSSTISPTIMDGVYRAGSNLFNQVHVRYSLPNGTQIERRSRMFPSMLMVDVLFKIRLDSHCRLTYCFGVGTQENCRVGEKDIALPSSYQHMPKRILGFAAPPDDYTSCTLCYDAYLRSLIPEEHQRLFIEIGNMVALDSTDPHMRYVADCCYAMEGLLYRPEMLMGMAEKNAALFVRTLLSSCITAGGRKLVDEIQPSTEDDLACILLEIHMSEMQGSGPNVIWRKLADKIKDHFARKVDLTAFELQVLVEIDEMETELVRIQENQHSSFSFNAGQYETKEYKHRG